jgi:hypothetical protein
VGTPGLGVLARVRCRVWVRSGVVAVLVAPGPRAIGDHQGARPPTIWAGCYEHRSEGLGTEYSKWGRVDGEVLDPFVSQCE